MPMNKRNMELSDKEYIELAEKLDAEQVILEETDIINNQYENLLKNRIILINDTISELTIDKVVMPLLQMDNDETGKKITIYINTNGGSVYDGLCLCNIIETLKTETEIIVLGYAYSMGFAILCSGSKNPNVIKKCYPFTTALWHPGQVALSGSANDVNDIQEFNKKVALILKNYILENTFISKELYEKNERSQFYLTAQELFHYGIIDEIINEVKIPQLCKTCLLRRECENCIDYAYENITEDFSCEDFEPDV